MRFSKLCLSSALLVTRLLSRLIFLVLAYVWPYRRKVIIENLVTCFPRCSVQEIRQLATDYRRHIADLIAESWLLANVRAEDFEKLVSYENVALIHELLAANRDIVLIASHYGNWEYLYQLPKVAKCHVLAAYSPVSNRFFDQKLKTMRSRFGVHLVPKQEWYRATISRDVTAPSVFITIADQRPRKEGRQLVEFFGRPTYIQVGAARIALKRNSAVVYADVEKLGNSRYKFHFKLISENAFVTGEEGVMRSYYKCLETTIRRGPAYWLWSHNRWKTDPIPGKVQKQPKMLY